MTRYTVMGRPQPMMIRQARGKYLINKKETECLTKRGYQRDDAGSTLFEAWFTSQNLHQIIHNSFTVFKFCKTFCENSPET